MPPSNLQHSSRTIIYINGVLYGLATSFNFTVNYERKSIRGIDVPVPLELGAGGVEVTGTIGCLKVCGDGGAQGFGIAPQIMDVASEKYITLLLLDRLFQKVVFKSDQCQITSESWGMAVKGLMEGSLSFRALTWQNETSK